MWPLAGASGPHREGEEPKPMMDAGEKSDSAIVATKPTNKAGRPVAEPVERRAGTEGNAGQRRTRRAQDRAFVGNIVQAMQAYASGALGSQEIAFSDTDRIIAIGSDRMMAAVARARHALLKDHLKPGHVAIGSINSPMQCMMKEICAQCLQPHRDPQTGQTSYVFSCFNQDQPLDRVEFGVLNDRLKQNSLAEKLTAKWLQRCMPELRKLRRFV